LRQNDDNRNRGLSVEVRNGDVNFALRKFKKKVQEDGILQTLREKEFFEKPSITRAKAKKGRPCSLVKEIITNERRNNNNVRQQKKEITYEDRSRSQVRLQGRTYSS
jgi:small subunit ribosomal protein S21